MRQRSFYQLIEAPVDEDKFPFGRADVAFRQGRNRKSKRAAFKSKILRFNLQGRVELIIIEPTHIIHNNGCQQGFSYSAPSQVCFCPANIPVYPIQKSSFPMCFEPHLLYAESEKLNICRLPIPCTLLPFVRSFDSAADECRHHNGSGKALFSPGHLPYPHYINGHRR